MTYLGANNNYWHESRPVLCVDETYLHTSHTIPDKWTDDKADGAEATLKKGRRLIIVLAGEVYQI